MVIERTKDEILLRIPANFDTESLQKIINFLKYKEAIKKSQATENEIDEIRSEEHT